MKIVRKIFVKQIITEKSKEKMRTHFLNVKMRLEQECQQLLFEQRKLQAKKGVSSTEVENRFQVEINNRKEKMKEIDFKLEQLEILEIGSEIIEREVEALVEVSVGMQWDKIMDEKAIVIEDDVVKRIDEFR
ncbi:MAG TPA: YlqD family protein [Bacillota bacterium]|nr:YlqD family protein [Bacillota bacterium]